jgi:hypothetical protein
MADDYRPPGYTTGRPTDYRPEYCDMAVEFMGRGYSLTAFAAHIGVARMTVYEWESVHPQFSDAIKRARDARVLCLETELRNTEINAIVTSRIFMLKNAAKHEYNDKDDQKEFIGDVVKAIKRIIIDVPRDTDA